MGNIKNFNFNKIDLFLSNSEYWDFYLGIDEDYRTDFDCLISGDCVISQFDFFDSNIFENLDNKTIYSLRTWSDAINTGVTASTYGLTGLDNGVLNYIKNPLDITNQNLTNILTGSTLTIPSGDTRLFLNKVSGSTGNLTYPIELITDTTPLGNYMNFKGGFYQGYYKLDGFDYQVLPNRVNKGMMFEFWLKKDDSVKSQTPILNDIYPENKGIFMYLGTRAENKFWNQFDGNNTGSTSACTVGATEFCTIPKEEDILILNDEGFPLPLNPPLTKFTTISNEFLLYGRVSDKCDSDKDDKNFRLGSLLACEVTGATPTFTITSTTQTITNTLNPFLIFGRSKGGGSCGRPSDGYGRETICSFSGQTTDQTELDKDADIIDNALAFIIRDDGSIGYRLLTVTGNCVNNKTITGTSVTEKFSIAGVVSSNEWEHIAIRWVTNYYNDCKLIDGKRRTGRLMFYVNCRLKFIVEDFPEFIGRRLEDYKEKQVGVPYNISLGGGSQGLLESMTFDGQDQADLGLTIEKTFGGSFIGSISQFKIYGCDINWCALKTLCKNDRYNIIVDEECFLIDEQGEYILQEDGSRIIINCL